MNNENEQQIRLIDNQQILKMDKKVGIRLRHLDQPPPITIQQNQPIKPLQVPSERKSSQSPLGRKKIFNEKHKKTDHNYLINQLTQPNQFNHSHRQQYDYKMTSSSVVSPLNQPLRTEHNTIQDIVPKRQEDQYNHQHHFMLNSGRKQQNDVKDEMIQRLQRENQILKRQNEEFKKKYAELQQEILKLRRNQINEEYRHRSQSVREVRNNSNMSDNAFARNINNNLREQKEYFLPQRDRPSGHHQSVPKIKRRVLLDEGEDNTYKQQDSTVSDIVSPLLALNPNDQHNTSKQIFVQRNGNDGVTRNTQMSYQLYQNGWKKSNPKKQMHKISSQRPDIEENKYPQKQFYKFRDQYLSSQNQGNTNKNANRKTWKASQQYNIFNENERQQKIEKMCKRQVEVEQNRKYERVQKDDKQCEQFIPCFRGKQECKRDGKGWQTFQMSMSSLQDGDMSEFYNKNGKQLSIEDSKQFKFEDFNYSEGSDQDALQF